MPPELKTYRFSIRDGSIESFATVQAYDLADAYYDAFEGWWSKNASSINRWQNDHITVELKKYL